MRSLAWEDTAVGLRSAASIKSGSVLRVSRACVSLIVSDPVHNSSFNPYRRIPAESIYQYVTKPDTEAAGTPSSVFHDGWLASTVVVRALLWWMSLASMIGIAKCLDADDEPDEPVILIIEAVPLVAAESGSGDDAQVD